MPIVKRNPGNICTSMHAEEHVCKYIPCNVKNKPKKENYDLLVFRYDHGTFQLTQSRPCRRCIMIMKKNKINNVYYSTKNSQIVRERVEDMDSSKAHITSGMKKYLANKAKKKN